MSHKLKIKIFLSFFLAFSALTTSYANDGFYGQLIIGVQDKEAKNKNGQVDKLNSNQAIKMFDASFGAQTQNKLNETLYGVAGFEFSSIKRDNLYSDKKIEDMYLNTAYVGLNSQEGTVIFGKHQNPLVMVAATDAFPFSFSSDKYITANLGFYEVDNKIVGNDFWENSFLFISAPVNDFRFLAQFATNPDIKTSTNNQISTKKLDDHTSLALTHGSINNGFYLSFAINEQYLDKQKKKFTTEAYSLQYSSIKAMFNMTYRKYKNNNKPEISLPLSDDISFLKTLANEGDFYSTSVVLKLGKWQPKVKYATIEPRGSIFKTSTSLSYGINYIFGKKTQAFVEKIEIENDYQLSGSTYDANNKGIKNSANLKSSDARASIWSLGILQKF